MVRNRLEFGASVEDVWDYVLNNIPSLAQCVPGAELNQSIDGQTYVGKMGTRLGPIKLGFTGSVRIEHLDQEHHTARLRVEARETRGLGGATATVNAQIQPMDNGSICSLESEVEVSGVAAQLATPNLIQDVSQRLAERFAKCVEQEIEAARAR
jgi:carbon monoxide dehydrogenase subunit G